jgi:Domain of unknown function (DUF4261)
VSLIDRFFGKTAPHHDAGTPLVANTGIERPLSLQLLFAEAGPLDAQSLTRELKKVDRSMAHARCEIDDELSREGKLFGLAGWDEHVVRFIGFDAPMPAAVVESCVAPGHYPEELKARARAHRAHVLLSYAGYEATPLEQYVALAIVAAVLGRHGALVVLNEAARTSLPIRVLSDMAAHGKSVQMFHELPLPYLYCGFVKHEVEGVPGVWMRTYAAPLLGLPDLAAHAAGHHEGQRYFDLFENVLRYILESRAQVGRGHTMQIGADYMRLRAPKLTESFLVPNGELFVMEVIGPNEINR